MRFKVGDVVRVLFNHPQESYFRKGDKFQIEQINEDRDELSGRIGRKELNYVCSDDVELVTENILTHMPAWF